MKKLFTIFVFGLFLFPLVTFASDEEVEVQEVDGEEIELVMPAKAILRHEDNRMRQTVSTLERLKNQLEKVQKEFAVLLEEKSI